MTRSIFTLFVFSMLALTACQKKTTEGTSQMNDMPDKNGLSIGDKAPDFSLKGIDGEMTSLADYKKDKGVVVVFTCNHCPFAVAYEDRLIELHNKYAPKGFPVLAINPNDPKVVPDDSFENMQMRAKEKGFPFRYVIDAEQTVFRAYGATRTPHIYLLDADRKVRYIGAIDDNYANPAEVEKRFLSDAINALLMGEKVDPETTKAVGCTIKVQS